MSSLPQTSLLSMPPLERANTDISPSSEHTSSFSDRVSPHTYRAAPLIESIQHIPHPPHLQIQQQYNPSYTPFGPSYSVPTFPYQTNTPFPGFSPSHNPYYSAMPLPTIPPRYSSSDPINMPGRATCISPLDLFGALPSAQSLPTNPLHVGAFGGRSLGFGQQQTFLNEAVELDDEVEAETNSAPELMVLDESPSSSSSGASMAGIEEEEEAELFEPVEKVQPVKKGRKIMPAEQGERAMPIASPPKKGKVEVDGTPGDGTKEGKKRSRTAQACEKCRLRKARCFGGNPCNRCVKRKFTCEFTPTSARSRPLAIKPEIPTAAATAKPKVRRHSMHTVPATVPSIPNRTLAPSVHPPKNAAARAAAQSHHAHSRSMNMPRSMMDPGSVHPYIRGAASGLAPPIPSDSAGGTITAAAFALHHATTRPDGGLSSLLPAPTASLGLGLTDGLGLGLGLSLGLDFSPSPDTANPSPGADGDSDDMAGMTNSFSASGSSAPASNSGSGATGSGWSSLFQTSDGTSGTPNLGEDDIFQFSPVQHSELSQMQLDWAAGGMDAATGAIGGGYGYDALAQQAYGVGGLGADHGYSQGVGMEWFIQQQNQGAAFRA